MFKLKENAKYIRLPIHWNQV